MSDKLNIKPLEYVNQLELRNNGVDIFKAIDDIIVNSADVITDIIRDNEDPRIKLNAINTAVKIRRQLFEEKQFLVRLDLEKDKYAETKIDWGDAGIE